MRACEATIMKFSAEGPSREGTVERVLNKQGYAVKELAK